MRIFLPWGELETHLRALDGMMRRADLAGVRAMMQRLVSGYKPSGDLVDWVLLADKRQEVALAIDDVEDDEQRQSDESMQAPVACAAEIGCRGWRGAEAGFVGAGLSRAFLFLRATDCAAGGGRIAAEAAPTWNTGIRNRAVAVPGQFLMHAIDLRLWL